MSEIWDEFEKLALAQGLISEGSESDMEKFDPSESSRTDSLARDAVALLYGVQPDTIYDEKKTLMDQAHPDTFVVGRAYDAMNAVVENNYQRQDMMAYIALKQPNGHLTQRRYVAAKHELTNSLVKAAFLLDNRDEIELMSLADSCAARLDERGDRIVKEAMPAVAIAGIALGASVLIGAAYYFMYGATTAQGVYANSQKVLDALQPLASEPYARAIEADVTKIMRMAEQVYQVKDQIANVTSVDEAVDMAQQQANSAKMQAIIQRINTYLAQLQKIQRAIPGWVAKIKLVHSTSTEVKSDWWAKVISFTSRFTYEDWQTLIDSLAGQAGIMGGQVGGLLEAIQKEVQVMNGAKAAAHNSGPDIQSALQDTPPPQPGARPQALPGAPASGALPQPIPAPNPASPPGVARPGTPPNPAVDSDGFPVIPQSNFGGNALPNWGD